MLSPVLLSLFGASLTLAQTYSLTETYTPSNFFSKFDFFTQGDPTEGWTHYVDYKTATSSGLIKNPSVASWGVDHTNVLDPGNPAGRPSIRITSKSTYNHGLFIADIAHMPDSTCGLWPAYWFLGKTGTWPHSGEIDIIEGVNNAHSDLISAHTADGCTISGSGQTAPLLTNNCAVSYSATGCGSNVTASNSYGTGFNNNGGGIYAMQWTSSAISIWFFPRNAIPSSVTSAHPDPTKFGTPTAVFAGSCNIDSHFFDHNIIFDTTFCGQWAGNAFASTGCPMTAGQASWPSCVTYVAKNPNAFAQAYWTVNSIKVYTNTGAAAAAVPAGVLDDTSVIPVAATSSMDLSTLSVALGKPTTPPVQSSTSRVNSRPHQRPTGVAN